MNVSEGGPQLVDDRHVIMRQNNATVSEAHYVPFEMTNQELWIGVTFIAPLTMLLLVCVWVCLRVRVNRRIRNSAAALVAAAMISSQGADEDAADGGDEGVDPSKRTSRADQEPGDDYWYGDEAYFEALQEGLQARPTPIIRLQEGFHKRLPTNLLSSLAKQQRVKQLYSPTPASLMKHPSLHELRRVDVNKVVSHLEGRSRSRPSRVDEGQRESAGVNPAKPARPLHHEVI